MASQRRSFENQTGLEEIQEEQKFSSRSHSESCLSEDDAVSGYSSLHEEPLFGSVQERRTKQLLGENKRGEDTPPSLINTALTEADATEISSIIGKDWRSLGRNLKFPETTLESISDDKSYHSYEDKAHALLIKFIRQQGRDATKGKLAEALFRIGRRDIAEILIGNEHFASKTPEQKMFFLKEEGSFVVPGEDGQDARFLTCRDIHNGRLYLVRPLDGTGYEESCKTLRQQDTIADSILKTLDSSGIVKAEKQKKEKQKIKEIQDKIMELINGLQEVVSSLANQERNVDKIVVLQQLLEIEALLGEMQSLVTSFLQLTGIVAHLEDPIPLKAQLYSLSLGLNATLRDLEERVRMLKEMVPRDTKVPGRDPEKLLKWSQSMAKGIKMRENVFIKRFQEHTLEKRPRHGQNCASSEPPPRTSRYPVDVPEIRRSSTQPVSEEELRTLNEQVAPAPDPMEEVDDKW